jgi:hypothetical protein
VGFDTDTTAVFGQTLDFVQKTGILYPFFSILTPMPGTKLFDDFAREGRLDHQDWERYDTRHVVMQPAQMRRDQLMDGYVWLYEQAYGSDKLWERMERHWKGRKRGSNLVEKAFVAARLAPEMLRGDRELRSFYKQGFDLMRQRGLHADAGQLLYVLDSYDFSRFMRRFNSERRDENYRTFESGEAPREQVMQWQNEKAKKRSKASLPVVP